MSGLLESVYNASPAFLQNLFVTGYGLKIYRREYGSEFKCKLAEFEKQQWYSKEELLNYQAEKLQALIKHAYDKVPYYRRIMDERKLTPGDFHAVGDLHKLPVLTRDDVKDNLEALTALGYSHSELVHGHTSGTTGSPLQFYYDREVCLIKNVTDWRQKSWGGVKPGDRIAFFLGRVIVPPERKKPPFWRTNYLLNHMFFSSFHLSKENIDTYVKKLEEWGPVALEGYPSTAYIIAKFLLSKNRTLPLKAVFTSSETLFPQQREAIEKAFDCRLFDFYGMAERVVFATECDAHRGHHLNDDFGITEIADADGAPVSSGEMGRIVATGLHNYAMPLIRYQTSDVTAIDPEPCSCGRSFPLMSDVTTKAEDIVTTPDGRLVSSSILTHPFKPLHSVAESQIVQEDREHIVVKIIRLPSYTDADTEHLVTELRKRLGEEMQISVEFVESIPRTKAGKFRWVVSKVPLEF